MDTPETYEIVIVNYGRRQTVKSEVYLNYGLYREADEPIGMDYYVWVIRNANRTVVVDTGFSEHGGASRGRDTLIRPAEAFAALGVDPAASTVVITHAHYDHIGNLDAFPEAPIVMARAEWEFWSGPHAHRALFHHSVEDVELDTLRSAVEAGRVTFFEDALALAPGIDLVRVGGHTPGQSVVRVATDRGTVLLASDAVHYFEELDEDRPFAHMADLPESYDAFDLIRSWRGSGEVIEVISGHDPASRQQGEPVAGALAGLATTVGRLPVGSAR